MIPISGTTRLVAVIADPIGQIAAPRMLNPMLTRLGIDAVVVPLHVRADDLTQLIQAARAMRNLAGLLVTIPHKKSVVPLCDAASEAAHIARAANVIMRDSSGSLTALMTDGDGLVASLKARGIEVAGRSVYLAGAGGAACAIAAALVAGGVALLTIANRSRAIAEQLLERLAELPGGTALGLGTGDPKAHDIVINATSLGMRASDPLPFDLSKVDQDALVVDIVVGRTPLLIAAESRGLAIHAGDAMLEHQLESFVHLLGLRSEARA